MNIYFDIETRPAADAMQFKPTFAAPANLKDPAKIEAAIAEKEAEWLGRLALSAVTGEVCAIGYAIGEGPIELLIGKETEVIRIFWTVVKKTMGTLVGFNSNGFDLPFLWRRSLKCGIAPAPGVYERNRRLSYQHCDLMEIWSWHNNQERISLANLSKYLGLQAKTGSGAFFADLLLTDRAAAEEYLRLDVELVRQIAGRMGV
jgi:predicted PolB exonuclease-like 3'-5' exonuclease